MVTMRRRRLRLTGEEQRHIIGRALAWTITFGVAMLSKGVSSVEVPGGRASGFRWRRRRRSRMIDLRPYRRRRRRWPWSR
jgi:hypothetical protein